MLFYCLNWHISPMHATLASGSSSVDPKSQRIATGKQSLPQSTNDNIDSRATFSPFSPAGIEFGPSVMIQSNNGRRTCSVLASRKWWQEWGQNRVKATANEHYIMRREADDCLWYPICSYQMEYHLNAGIIHVCSNFTSDVDCSGPWGMLVSEK